MLKKVLSVVLSVTLVIVSAAGIFGGSVFAESANPLQLNVLAVNSYTGSLQYGLVISAQYTDATLGNDDNVRMYAKVKQLSTNTVGEAFEINTLNYDSTERDAFDKGVVQTAQNKMGMANFIFFLPDTEFTYTEDYRVYIWSEDSSGKKSGVSENIINDDFEGMDSDWSQVSGSDWLKYIDSSEMLSQINLPGTHDSAAAKFTTLESYNKTQNVYIGEQLTYGARYLDIRINAEAKPLADESMSTGTTDYATCHASYNAKKADGSDYMMSEVIKECYDFLKAHPTEFIYFNVQQDNKRDDGAFQRTIHEYISKNPDMWFVKSMNPTLGEVRGKLIYARRFEDGGYKDFSGGTRFYWDAQEGTSASQTYTTGTARPVNDSLNSAPHEIVYHIQDFYKVSAANKWTIVKRQLDSMLPSGPFNEYFYHGLNSAATLSSPASNAKTINGNFASYELDLGKMYGWIIFDFITPELSKKVFSSNYKAANASDDDSFRKTVLHYDFSKIGSDNIVKDLTGHGFDGKLANSQLAVKDDGFITLKNSGKRALSGAGVDIPIYAFRGTNSKVTLSALVNPSALGKKTWFSVGNLSTQDNAKGTEDNWAALLTDWEGSGPRWAARSKGLEEAMFNSEKTLSAGNWQLLTYVMDNNSVKIYINAVLAGEYTGFSCSFDDVGNICPISLGRATHWDDDDFVGSIGDFKIYNYAQSAQEISNDLSELTDVTGIAVNKSELDLSVGKSERLSAEITPVFALDKAVAWSSDNPDIAKVEPDGTVKAVSEGSATITAASADGKFTAQCVVNVTKASEDTSSGSDDNVSSGDNSSGSEGDSSGSEGDSSGTGGDPSESDPGGNTSSSGGTSSGLGVTAIRLSALKTTVAVGKKCTVKAFVYPESANASAQLKWSSSDAKIASVSAGGTVKGVSAGRAKIKAQSADGKASAVITITVKPNKVLKVKAKQISGNKLKITFKKPKKISGVQIALRKGSGKFKTVKKGSVSKFVTKKLKKGKYQIKVRAYKKTASGTIYGDYSKVCKKTVK